MSSEKNNTHEGLHKAAMHEAAHSNEFHEILHQQAMTSINTDTTEQKDALPLSPETQAEVKNVETALDLQAYNREHGITLENFQGSFTIDTAINFLSSKKEDTYQVVLKKLIDARNYCTKNGMDLEQFFESSPEVFEERMESWMQRLRVSDDAKHNAYFSAPEEGNVSKRDFVWLVDARNEYRKLKNLANNIEIQTDRARLAREVNINDLPVVAGVKDVKEVPVVRTRVINGKNVPVAYTAEGESYIESIGAKRGAIEEVMKEGLSKFRKLTLVEKGVLLGFTAWAISSAFGATKDNDSGLKKLIRGATYVGGGAAVFETFWRFINNGESPFMSYIKGKAGSTGLDMPQEEVRVLGGKEKALDFRESIAYMGHVSFPDMVARYRTAPGKEIRHPDIDNNYISPAQVYTAVGTALRYKPQLAEVLMKRQPPLSWAAAVSLMLTDNQAPPKGILDTIEDKTTSTWLEVYNRLTLGEGFGIIKPLYLKLFRRTEASNAEIEKWLKEMIQNDIYDKDDFQRLLAEKFTAEDAERMREVQEKGEVDTDDRMIHYLEKNGVIYAMCTSPIKTSADLNKSAMTVDAFTQGAKRIRLFFGRKTGKTADDATLVPRVRFMGAIQTQNKDTITVCYALDKGGWGREPVDQEHTGPTREQEGQDKTSKKSK